MGFWPYVPAYPPCSGRPMPGTAAIQVALLERFDRSFDYGIYNCRPLTTDASKPSIHSDGRAGDLGFPDGWTGQRRPVTNPHPQGYLAAELLRANAAELGIMGIIWNRRRWDYRSPWGRNYTGPNPHIDHVHYEQHPTLASTLTVGLAASLIGEPEMAFTPQEEAALKRIAPYASRLEGLITSLFEPGPTTGAIGNEKSLLHVLEVHRLVARGVVDDPADNLSGDDHIRIAARLLGQ